MTIGLPTTPLVVSILAWIPLTLFLFRVLGPRRATLISVLGGYVFLPFQRMSVIGSLTELQLAWKGVTTGLALILGVLLFDRQSLRRFRPSWLDLAMAAFVAYPLVGLAMGGPSASADVLELLIQRTLGLLIPYVMGRLYFSETEGVTLLAAGVVLATLAHAPVIFWEAVMGPEWFAMTIIYRVPAAIEERLGSWTPQGFMMRRLELSAWSSMAAALAVWLWAGRGWRPKWKFCPSWVPALTLVAAALVNRSVYGYVTLAAGLVMVTLTLGFRTRLFLILLAATLPLYAGLRITGILDTTTLVERTKEVVPGTWRTVAIRLDAEQEKFDLLSPIGLVFGRGHQVWSLKNTEKDLKYPDGLWVQLLWQGGLVGLILHYLSIHLLPIGCALSQPRGRPRREQIGSPAWGLALFSILEMTDSIHNSALVYPMALIAGSLVGLVLGRSRPWNAFETETATSRAETEARQRPFEANKPRPHPHPPMPASLPTVVALACLLYVFGHGPVAGFDEVKLLGGLGAALLFGATGAVAAWASPRFSSVRLCLFGLLFGVLGISLNLAMHPNARPVAAADLFQGMALCGVAVALWRKAFRGGIWADSILAASPLLIHFGVGLQWPGFPGSQYLLGGNAELGAFFPMAPWLALAALGARSSAESIEFNLSCALAFGGGAAAIWLGPLGPEPPIKFPMNVSYALLACSATALAFTMAKWLNPWAKVRAWGRWLASRWLLFFYLHFGVAAGLSALKVEAPAMVWPSLAVLGLGATWLCSSVASRFSGAFRKPWPWLIPLALIAIAWGLPEGTTPMAILGCSATAGLVFAAYWKELVHVVANAGKAGSAPLRSAKPRAEPPRWADPDESAESPPDRDTRPAAALGRLGLLLALLLSPEWIGGIEGPVGMPANRPPREVPGEESDPSPVLDPSPKAPIPPPP